MTLSNYVTLGRSGLKVSRLCLGTMTFGNQWGWGCDDATSISILERYLAEGGNFIDTANIYTKGHSERIIGDYFSSKQASVSNIPRDRVVIATKFMGNMYRDDPNGGGGGRKSIILACEQSLRRLKTDYIDLYWSHFWDQETPLDETLRAMEDLVRSGKVRYLGLSDHPAWVCAHAQHILKEMSGSPLIALQIEYSLAQRTVEAELITMAQHFGMGVTPWSPLRGGILSGKFSRTNLPTANSTTRVKESSPHLHEKNFNIIDTLQNIAAEQSETLSKTVSIAQVALGWLLKKPGVSSIIMGVRSIEQFEDNSLACSFELDNSQMQRLDNVSAVTLPFPYEFLNNAKTLINGGTCINGEKRDYWELCPSNDRERA